MQENNMFQSKGPQKQIDLHQELTFTSHLNHISKTTKQSSQAHIKSLVQNRMI
ncbi:hypothetical protein [Peribacillus sp. R9-11]|uniref:hypothetical protein n=1 Tax=Peribacillus sp. R9-11 TaxID=3073271 RepID=UPI0028687D8B|nr:hypothetical protein [Peribacillus sp. R9-11]WMX58572.1 hypothetical protein RE409_29135 [Peribacillus sp. R9-11]